MKATITFTFNLPSDVDGYSDADWAVSNKLIEIAAQMGDTIDYDLPEGVTMTTTYTDPV